MVTLQNIIYYLNDIKGVLFLYLHKSPNELSCMCVYVFVRE